MLKNYYKIIWQGYSKKLFQFLTLKLKMAFSLTHPKQEQKVQYYALTNSVHFFAF